MAPAEIGTSVSVEITWQRAVDFAGVAGYRL